MISNFTRLLLILRIINLVEKRRIHNTALDKETLSIHRDGGNNENETRKNSRNIKTKTKGNIYINIPFNKQRVIATMS